MKVYIFDIGCHEMNVCVDSEVKNRVVFVSKWDTKEDFLAHVQGETFAKHVSGMEQYYEFGTDTFLEMTE